MKSASGPPVKRGYRMVARAESAAETAERILDAAIAEFWGRPTTDISLDAIAERAGVSVPTIVRRFGGKNELFAAAARREASRVAAERTVPVDGDVADAVAVLVAHYERVGAGVLRLLAESGRVPGLDAIVEQGRTTHREWCETAFVAALRPLRGEARRRRLAQFVAVCDVQTWALLRHVSGLSRRQTEAALVELLEPLTGGRS